MSDIDWVSMQIEQSPGSARQARSPSLIRTTSFRLAACGAILASLGAGLVFLVIYYGTAGAMVRTLDRQIGNEAAEIVDPGEILRTAVAMEAVREAQSEVVHGTFVTLIDPQGHVVATNLADPSRMQGWSWHNLIVMHPASHIMTTRNLGIRLADGGLLVVGEDATALVELRQRLVRSFFIGFSILLALGLGAGIVLGQNAVSRIKDINATLESIMGGDFSRRLTRSSYRNELDDLAVSVNLMLDRIEFLMENLRQVGNEIAHDLRSPLARLREGLELAQLGNDETLSRSVIPWAISETDSILA
ncbi:HAMP domain-containing protein, partial [Acidocella sp. MX-AZ02]|uniref:HAMP domain-containing protein n=2 Tax=unclassified Acidocella TaxID=2648610 RepID=UPI001181963B